MPILAEGEHVRDAFEVERLLGEGSFAEVYRVRHRFLRRRFAMKLFKTPSGSLEALEERLGESRILAQLEHPNIVRIADANLIMREGLAYGYFTMEYVGLSDVEEEIAALRSVFGTQAQAFDGIDLAR